MHIRDATDRQQWESFLLAQPFTPFLQSWAMGEVYQRIGQQPLRWQVEENGTVRGICFGHIVPARRGKHLSIPYGPVLQSMESLPALLDAISKTARANGCTFIRLSPFWPLNEAMKIPWGSKAPKPAPLHLLAEHLWYLPLTQPDPWQQTGDERRATSASRSSTEIFSQMRSTTRNLIRRAEKEGVTIEPSHHPVEDLQHFLALHDETRKRHGFTPYTNAFFRAQVETFAPLGQLTLYLARYQGQVIAASIHMHYGKETSYHHGASSHAFAKIPSSYLLQWRAISDALARGDHVYNFWGIAPANRSTNGEGQIAKESGNSQIVNRKSQLRRHPFAGVTLFKTGFGGNLLELTHCIDIPLSPKYRITRMIEQVRKWKRGF